MKMILAIAFVLCLSLSACASRQPVPGMENITSVTDVRKVKKRQRRRAYYSSLRG